jgi:hypothetical protein
MRKECNETDWAGHGTRHGERVAMGARALPGERYLSRAMPSFFIFL